MLSLIWISLDVYHTLGLLPPGLGLDSYGSVARYLQGLHVVSGN